MWTFRCELRLFCPHQFQELEDAEFIPMESREPPTPQILAPHPQNIPHVDHPDLVSSSLSASQTQKSLNASSISIGLPSSSSHPPHHGLPPSVPPLCLDGLSGSGDSVRLQMIQNRVRDEEIEALNERLIYLEAENKRVSILWKMITWGGYGLLNSYCSHENAI